MEDVQAASQRYIRDMLNIALIRGPDGKAGFLLMSKSLGSSILRARKTGPLSVASIAEDGTAAHSGLLVSDLLHAVDGRNVENCGLKDVAALLQGAPGSRVVLTVSRIRTHDSSNGEFVQNMEETFSAEAPTSLTFCQRMQRCQEACSKLHTIVQEDVLAAPRYSCGLDHDGLRSTLGMMLHEVDGRIVIDDLVPGGPAFKSNEVDAGDIIEAVDGVTVSPDNYHTILIGSDIPGSIATITIIRGEKSALLHAQNPGQVLEASLRRMDRSEVKDHVELYELFMEIKSDLDANAPKDALMQRVDACVQQWKHTLLADEAHHRLVAEKCAKNRGNSLLRLHELRRELDMIRKSNYFDVTAPQHARAAQNLQQELAEALDRNASLDQQLQETRQALRKAVDQAEAKLAKVEKEKEKALEMVGNLQNESVRMRNEHQQSLEEHAKYLKMASEDDLINLEAKHRDEVCKLEAKFAQNRLQLDHEKSQRQAAERQLAEAAELESQVVSYDRINSAVAKQLDALEHELTAMREESASKKVAMLSRLRAVAKKVREIAKTERDKQLLEGQLKDSESHIRRLQDEAKAHNASIRSSELGLQAAKEQIVKLERELAEARMDLEAVNKNVARRLIISPAIAESEDSAAEELDKELAAARRALTWERKAWDQAQKDMQQVITTLRSQLNEATVTQEKQSILLNEAFTQTYTLQEEVRHLADSLLEAKHRTFSIACNRLKGVKANLAVLTEAFAVTKERLYEVESKACAGKMLPNTHISPHRRAQIASNPRSRQLREEEDFACNHRYSGAQTAREWRNATTYDQSENGSEHRLTQGHRYRIPEFVRSKPFEEDTLQSSKPAPQHEMRRPAVPKLALDKVPSLSSAGSRNETGDSRSEGVFSQTLSLTMAAIALSPRLGSKSEVLSRLRSDARRGPEEQQGAQL